QGKLLEARGDVRTVSLPRSSGQGAPGFGARSAVSFQASEMRADHAAGRAAYRGSARAWQEGNSIQADEILLDRPSRQLHAAGSVLARWTEAPAPGGRPDARPGVTSITARSMVVDDALGSTSYRDDVRLTRPDATLTAD